MSILLTGGAGYIGSHMAGYLLKNNFEFIVFDNLSTSSLENLEKLEKKYNKKINFVNGDLREIKDIQNVFGNFYIHSVIHFAGLKSVEESLLKPDHYYDNNVLGSQNLMNVSSSNKVRNFIFSSSACIYGEPNSLPIKENHPFNPFSVYGLNKVAVEELLINDSFFKSECNTVILRYFNPIGSFYDNTIGESSLGKVSNLMPNIIKVLRKESSHLKIYGSDYDTPDGTAIRDFIHILDLIESHLKSFDLPNDGIKIFNVGTGIGYTVLSVLQTFNKVNKVELPYKFYPRRPGDISSCFSSVNKISSVLGWTASRNLESMCRDSYLFSIINE